MRLHGDRIPHEKPILISSGGKECAPSGADNEVWSYGEKVETVLRKFINLRYRLKPYIAKAMEQWRKDARKEPIIIDIDSLVPADHLLRKIKKVMD